jgi:hypothetical protein
MPVKNTYFNNNLICLPNVFKFVVLKIETMKVIRTRGEDCLKKS